VKLFRSPLSTILAGVLFATLLTGAPAFIDEAKAENQPRKILSGWLPYYSTRTSLAATVGNADLIREIMPFWYTLKYNGNTKQTNVTDLYASANPSIPKIQTVTSLRNAGVLLIPTITDGTQKLMLSNLMSRPASRTQIVNAIAETVRVNNYDGIDLNFEGFSFVDGSSTWTRTAPFWVALVKELSAVLRAEKKLLSVTSPFVLDPAGRQRGYFVYSWAAIAPYIDRLRIMTYDYSVAKPGPIGPISWAERTVQYAVSIMPASKVYVGLPGYGRDWVTAVSGVCPANVASVIRPGGKAATFVMRNAANLAATYGATPQYNATHAETTFTYKKVYNGVTAGGLATSCTATRTAWYQDARGYEQRALMVAKYRLGGLAAWTIGMEEPLALERIRNVARSIAPDRVVAAINTNLAKVNYGEAVTVSGNFTIRDKAPLANVAIRIEGRSPGETTWRLLSNVMTDDSGKFTRAIIIGRSSAIRAFSEGTWERNEGISNQIPLSVSRLVLPSAPTAIKVGETLTVTGSIRPRTAATFMTLESLVDGKWRAIGSPTLTDDNGEFIFEVRNLKRGVLTLRVSAAAEELNPLTISSQFAVLIRGPFAPELVK